MEETVNRKMQIVYFSHGGGPLPILGDPSHKAMLDFMKRLPDKLHKPDAVIVISAHWEEDKPLLLGNSNPEMFYDYYGFPEEAYKINYPAPGYPELAGRINELFKHGGINSGIDLNRGFDHGLYIPLKMMYPSADIPVIQLSLIRGLDPAEHIEMGKALRQLEGENILVIGSGFSFHNMRAFDWKGVNTRDAANDEFQDWLITSCTGKDDFIATEKDLLDWVKAPNARYCHPREEHLMPLHVCAGLAGVKAGVIFDDYILGKRAVAFEW